MEYTFGIDQMLTETMFVRDEKLDRFHDDFENSVTANHLFSNNHQDRESVSVFKLHIDRGRLPPGSIIFQTVLAEFVKRRKSLDIVRDTPDEQNGGGGSENIQSKF